MKCLDLPRAALTAGAHEISPIRIRFWTISDYLEMNQAKGCASPRGLQQEMYFIFKSLFEWNSIKMAINMWMPPPPPPQFFREKVHETVCKLQFAMTFHLSSLVVICKTESRFTFPSHPTSFFVKAQWITDVIFSNSDHIGFVVWSSSILNLSLISPSK